MLIPVWLVLLSLAQNPEVRAQLEFEGAPIDYATAPVHDPVAVLQKKLDGG